MVCHSIYRISGSIDFGNYNGYLAWPFQVVGIISALLVFGIVFYGALDSKSLEFLIVDDQRNSSQSADVELQERQSFNKSSSPEGSATDYSNMDELEQSEKPNGVTATTGATLA